MMPTYTFEEVALYADKSVKCSVCGKRLKRSKKFSQTINPFNKTADGRLKTRSEIMDELEIKSQVWKEQPEVCSKCKEVQ